MATGNVNKLDIKKYSGDERLALLLGNSGCAKSIDFVKAAILGAQASAERFGLDNVVREIFPEARLLGSANELISELEGLWFVLYGSKRLPPAAHIVPDAGPAQRQSLTGFVSRQIGAGEEFLKYLHHGRTDNFFDAPRLQKIYSVFYGNLELLKALQKSMEESWSDEDFAGAESLIKKLTSFTRVFWDSMVSIKDIVKNRKLEKMKNLTIIRDIESQLQREVRRNDQCPCGSGKKYKVCCGRAV